MLTDCLDMLVLGTSWKTRHSVVCQQTCKSSHKMECDRRLTRLISCIHHTNEFRQYCLVSITSQHFRLGYFKTQTLLKTLRTRNQPRESLMYLRKPNILSPSVGSARNRRQYPTVLQSLRSFPWMLDCEWIDHNTN